MNVYGLSSTLYNSYLSYQGIQYNIKTNTPILCALYSIYWGGHAVLACGYDLSSNNVYVMNPYDYSFSWQSYNNFYTNYPESSWNWSQTIYLN